MCAWGAARGLFLSDEEMGKKDDDHGRPGASSKPAPAPGGARTPTWHPARGPQRRLAKRVFLVLLGALLIYVFVQNIPTDLGPARSGRPVYGNTRQSGVGVVSGDSEGISSPGMRTPEVGRVFHDEPSQQHTYTGPPKFMQLAASLHAISATRGGMMLNKNILFAASSLTSAALLLPVACQMGQVRRNYVHFALMGRSQISMEDLQKINGVDETCQIIFHDARTEKAAMMTDERMEYSDFRAFHHIHWYMHPQAILVDGSGWEDWFFTKAVAAHVKVTSNTMIELPYSPKPILWMTKLDSRSIRAWDKNSIEILVQAIPGTSGGLVRLLRSLSSADFSASTIPHLTIELPSDVDPPTKEFLENFRWPPSRFPNPTGAKYMTLRHRVTRKRLTEEESSARFLESFWPADPKQSHVLVLSPQVELAPNFFHYLKYTLLEHKYSEAASIQHWDARLLGISLAQPTQLLSGDAALTPPLYHDEAAEANIPASYVWQAPTSLAMLFLGDKWIELHDLVTRSLDVQSSEDTTPPLLSKKVVSKQYPSWLEHALRLSRLRGYWTLYPGDETVKSLLTVHTELHHDPEEYAQVGQPIKLTDKSTEQDIEKALEQIKRGPEVTVDAESPLQGLIEAGVLRPFGRLPVLSWDGKTTDAKALDEMTAVYASEFKAQVGKCDPKGPNKKLSPLSVEDLFCEED